MRAIRQWLCGVLCTYAAAGGFCHAQDVRRVTAVAVSAAVEVATNAARQNGVSATDASAQGGGGAVKKEAQGGGGVAKKEAQGGG
ncbi:MAG: hypothetical protein WCR06_00740, partial [bacterium]